MEFTETYSSRHIILKRLNELHHEIAHADYNISVMTSSPRTHSEKEIVSEIERREGLHKEQSELCRKQIKLYPRVITDAEKGEK